MCRIVHSVQFHLSSLIYSKISTSMRCECSLPIREGRLYCYAKSYVKKLAREAEDAAKSARLQQREVSNQLAQVEPRVETARLAVDGINKNHLDELKTMPSPPEKVAHTIEIVLYLLNGAKTAPSAPTKQSWLALRGKLRSAEFVRCYFRL